MHSKYFQQLYLKNNTNQTYLYKFKVALTCGSITQPLEDDRFIIDNWIEFQSNNDKLYKLRNALLCICTYKIQNANYKFTNFENDVIDTVVSIISAEDSANGNIIFKTSSNLFLNDFF